ncbi:hypothetical protein C8A00DRAFT_36927 [Chaetomidium leptoderma]|uniref:Uncharacterized protein n=1 Tax=Chaetomidium leptoderma TaxID=669021 RepID=A0AAN6VFG3_9PEZI|nr:hypothetical protein C8A00DRAFT_36927 [Chaetomidium leptoderma]
MALSTIWRELPGDLAEQILSQLVATHFHRDPAYTWACLRHLSAHQKHVIEYRFAQFWLPKLSITLYSGVRHKFEYALDKTPNPDDSDRATFSIERQIHHPLLGLSQDSVPGALTEKCLRDAWDQYDPATFRNITVRLGEGYLSGGCRGGYLVNDTDIPGLQFLPGRKIRFCWKEAMNGLLREELYMRKVGDEMFAEACNRWCAQNLQAPPATAGNGPPVPPLHIQVRFWRCDIQSARRVAVFKHRVAKSKESARAVQLRFAVHSVNLHKQELYLDSVIRNNWLALRTQAPDIFEVASVEESVVPRFDVFQRWLDQGRQEYEGDGDGDVRAETILDLYRDEYAWSCRTGSPDDEGVGIEAFWEKTGRRTADTSYSRLEFILILAGKTKRRWDPAP